MKNFKFLVVAFVIGSSTITIGQTSYGELNTWFFTLTKLKFNDKFYSSLELHERLEAPFHDQSTLIIRPSISFIPKENFMLTAGYSYVNSAASELYNLPIVKIENNLWEQLEFKFNIGEVKLLNRLRQEHRFIDRIVTDNNCNIVDGITKANRLRFSLSAQRKIVELGDNNLFALIGDELWMNQSKQLIPMGVVRNWIFSGVGFDFKGKQSVQLRYMHQYDIMGSTTFISSSIVQFVYTQNIEF